MKKQLYFLLLLIIPMFLINCGSDDEDFNAQFVGQWEAASIKSTGCNDSSLNGTLTCTPFCIQITFNSDGTYTMVDGSSGTVENENGTYVATESTIDLCTNGTCSDDPGTYSFSDSETVTVKFTDSEAPGCVFTATFSKK